MNKAKGKEKKEGGFFANLFSRNHNNKEVLPPMSVEHKLSQSTGDSSSSSSGGSLSGSSPVLNNTMSLSQGNNPHDLGQPKKYYTFNPVTTKTQAVHSTNSTPSIINSPKTKEDSKQAQPENHITTPSTPTTVSYKFISSQDGNQQHGSPNSNQIYYSNNFNQTVQPVTASPSSQSDNPSNNPIYYTFSQAQNSSPRGTVTNTNSTNLSQKVLQLQSVVFQAQQQAQHQQKLEQASKKKKKKMTEPEFSDTESEDLSFFDAAETSESLGSAFQQAGGAISNVRSVAPLISPKTATPVVNLAGNNPDQDTDHHE